MLYYCYTEYAQVHTNKNNNIYLIYNNECTYILDIELKKGAK